MLDIEKYMNGLVARLRAAFGDRLCYVGLQGSFLRGEADGNSDIDAMVVLDTLAQADMDVYRNIINEMPEAERACGFISGRAELAGWNRCEVFSLINSTKGYYGELSKLTPEYSRDDIEMYVKISAGNMYHELCHRYIHSTPARNREALPQVYKGAFFIMQNLYYLRTGVFPATRAAMLEAAIGADREIMLTAKRLRDGGEYDFDSAYAAILEWCAGILRQENKIYRVTTP